MKLSLTWPSVEGNDETAKANRRRNTARFAFELFLIGLPVSFEKTFRQVKEIVTKFYVIENK